MSHYLSYLMGGNDIQDSQLEILGIKIVEKESDGDRKLEIQSETLAQYIQLVKDKLTLGFWNEIVGREEILFIFKFKDRGIKEYKLSLDNEIEIDKLCAEFNNEQPGKVHNVYKWLSKNNFYHDFMVEHYSELINR